MLVIYIIPFFLGNKGHDCAALRRNTGGCEMYVEAGFELEVIVPAWIRWKSTPEDSGDIPLNNALKLIFRNLKVTFYSRVNVFRRNPKIIQRFLFGGKMLVHYLFLFYVVCSSNN